MFVTEFEGIRSSVDCGKIADSQQSFFTLLPESDSMQHHCLWPTNTEI